MKYCQVAFDVIRRTIYIYIGDSLENQVVFDVCQVIIVVLNV